MALLTMLGVSLTVFVAMRMLPGGFEMIILGPIQTEEARAVVTEQFGLDRSLPEQFLSWLGAVLHGDFGISMITRIPIADEVLRRLGATVQLTAMAVITALCVGLPLGVAAGLADSSRRVRAGGRLVGALRRPRLRLLGVVSGAHGGRLRALLRGSARQPARHDPARLHAERLRHRAHPAHDAGVGPHRDDRGLHHELRWPAGTDPASIVRRHVLRNASLPGA